MAVPSAAALTLRLAGICVEDTKGIFKAALSSLGAGLRWTDGEHRHHGPGIWVTGTKKVPQGRIVILGCRFALDGGIGVSFQAGGYMETIFWQPPATDAERTFGTIVHGRVHAPLHDHLAGARVHGRLLSGAICGFGRLGTAAPFSD